MGAEMADALRDVVDTLARLGAVEIWLFGSYANEKAKPDSDVDLLVVGPKSLFDELRAEEAWPTYDIFVNVNGKDEFRSPWRKASGSYSGWHWRQIAEDRAIYIAMKPNKWIPEHAMGISATAIRIFARGESQSGCPKT